MVGVHLTVGEIARLDAACAKSGIKTRAGAMYAAFLLWCRSLRVEEPGRPAAPADNMSAKVR
jgi:hypothetical protein